MSPPLALHEGPPTDWDDVLAEMDRADAAQTLHVRRNEIRETDLGTPLDRLPEIKRAPKQEPRSPYEGWPTFFDEGRWRFPNVIGMMGPWYGPVLYWADYQAGADPIVHEVRDAPCWGCGGAWLSAETICGQCDRSGKDHKMPAVTTAERRADKTKYVPPKGVKGGTG